MTDKKVTRKHFSERKKSPPQSQQDSLQKVTVEKLARNPPSVVSLSQTELKKVKELVNNSSQIVRKQAEKSEVKGSPPKPRASNRSLILPKRNLRIQIKETDTEKRENSESVKLKSKQFTKRYKKIRKKISFEKLGFELWRTDDHLLYDQDGIEDYHGSVESSELNYDYDGLKD